MTLNKNTYPYFDDYNEDKKYLQILFRPGYAVQSRELSQMQTMLQKQVERFGKHVFKEGAMVIPGGISLDSNYAFVKLQNQFSGTDITVADFLGKQVTGLTSGAVATVLSVETKTTTDPNTLYLKYTVGTTNRSATGTLVSGSNTITNISIDTTTNITLGAKVAGIGVPADTFVTGVTNATTIILNNSVTTSGSNVSLTFVTSEKFLDNETIATVNSVPTNIKKAQTAATSSTGLSSRVEIQEGVYFVNGYFCLVETQSIILDKYDNTPSYKIGLKYTDSFITEEDDPSLVDPASGASNFNAPGAHRYYVELVLSKYNLTETLPSTFIELIRVENGIIQKQVTRAEYSELEKTLARRTYDESGDYTVRHFPLQIREHLNDGSNFGIYSAPQGDTSKLVYMIEPGKAYVKGYEIELQSSLFLDVPKSREFLSKNNYTVSSTMGSYVDITHVTGTFDLTSLETLNLVDGSSTTVGTAKVRGFEFVSGTPGTVGAKYRLFLFNVAMNTGHYFSEVRTITGTGKSGTVVLTDTIAVLEDATNSKALIQIPEYAVKTISDMSYTTKRYTSGTMSGTSITLTAGTNEVFAAGNLFNYHVAIVTKSSTANTNGYNNGDVIDLTAAGNSIVLGGSPVGKQVTITIPSISGSTISVISTVIKSNVVPKTKTLTTRTQTLAHSGTVQLDKADIYKIVSITDATTSADITERYRLDNGQHDSYYDRGSLTFDTSYAAPAGNITVVYQYFAHGTGDCFTVNSYDGVIDYSDIPSFYSPATGKYFDLINCLDFRPRMNDSGTGFANTTEQVADGEVVTFDYDYYTSRIDKIVLDSSGNFKIINGVSDINPLPPKDPENAMVLYQITVPPYTFSPKDVYFKMIDNKRYTMRDIGKLEKRIENLEYYTSLNLLEKDTSDMFIDDGTGMNRFKNGFIVDNFKSHLIGNGALSDYQCSIDSTNGTLRPPFVKNNVALELYATGSSNYSKTGTLITVPYTTKVLISQPFASKVENINPYNVFSWVGNVKLSPSSDNWYEVTNLPDVVIETEEAMSNVVASANGSTVWGDWETTWTGKEISRTATSPTTTNNYTGWNWTNKRQNEALTSFRAAGVSTVGYSNVRLGAGGTTLIGTKQETVTKEVGQTRTGIVTEAVATVTNQVIDDKVIDTSVVPYIRKKGITFTANGLKPNTRVYPFFDNVDVSDYCRPDTTGSTNGQSLVTDQNGSVSGFFDIPNDDTIRFRTGERVFKLVDNNVNSFLGSTSASSIYAATGILQTKQATIQSTKRYELATRTITEEQTTIITTDESTDVTVKWLDPLAQTFLIDNTEGVFISHVNLYFASKDSANIPVTLQIRNTINGVPGQYIVPLSEMTLNPSQINISSDGTVATTFTFDSPVYLKGNTEYCFVLLANSNEYNVWCSKIGDVDVVSGQRISNQPYAGVMFKSSNSSTWTPDQEQDIKFEIHRCVFNTGVNSEVLFKNGKMDAQLLPENPITTTAASTILTIYHPSHCMKTGRTVTLSGITGTQNGMIGLTLNREFVITVVDTDNYTISLDSNDTLPTVSGICGGLAVYATHDITLDAIDITSQTMVFTNTSLGWGFKGTDSTDTLDTNYSAIVTDRTIEFNSPRYIINENNEAATKSIHVLAEMATTSEWVSPVIDTERLSVITVTNRINNDSSNETNASSGNAIARYITKRVTLSTEATSLQVNFAAIRPENATIKVYGKFLESTTQTTDFNSVDYVEIPATNYPNSDDANMVDYSFAIDDLTPYTVFSVKVVMLSSETSDIPVIKDFRAIALG